jgi:hypothetical protein
MALPVLISPAVPAVLRFHQYAVTAYPPENMRVNQRVWSKDSPLSSIYQALLRLFAATRTFRLAYDDH